MPQVLKKRCNFTFRWLPDLGNTSEQNLKLKTLGYLLFISAILYLLFDCPMANFWLLLTKQSISWCWSLHLGYQYLVQRWLRGIGSPHGTGCPVGFDHNDLTTHPKLQKIISHTSTQFFWNVEMPPMIKKQ